MPKKQVKPKQTIPRLTRQGKIESLRVELDYNYKAVDYGLKIGSAFFAVAAILISLYPLSVAQQSQWVVALGAVACLYLAWQFKGTISSAAKSAVKTKDELRELLEGKKINKNSFQNAEISQNTFLSSLKSSLYYGAKLLARWLEGIGIALMASGLILHMTNKLSTQAIAGITLDSAFAASSGVATLIIGGILSILIESKRKSNNND